MNQVINPWKPSGLFSPHMGDFGGAITWCPLRGHTDEYQYWRSGEYKGSILPWEK